MRATNHVSANHPNSTVQRTGAHANLEDTACALPPGVPNQMKVLQIATVGENPDAVFVGVRAFPITKLVLIHTPEFAVAAHELARRAGLIKLDVSVLKVEGEPLLGCLRIVSELVQSERPKFDDIIVNTGSGPRMMTCSLLAAAFVNGVRAIDVMGDMPVALPVLKFSYTELVSGAKLAILRTLDTVGGRVESLEALSHATKIDKTLLSYHIRGGRGSKGLESLGLLEVERGVQGRLGLSITPPGRLLLVGHLAHPTTEKRDAH